MTGYSTFYLFATALSVGVAVMLPLIPIRQIGRRFFILMSMIAVVFYALAVSSRGLDFEYAHAACAGMLIVYNISVSEKGGPLSFAILIAALGCGVAGLVLDARGYPDEVELSGSQPLWLSVSFVASALILGGALVSMLLGHWYLVAQGLSFDVLRRVVRVLLAALVLRIVVIGWIAVGQSDLWSRLWSDAGGAAGFFVSKGIFVGARALFGIALPIALVLMARECVRIRSNQSATGILYVVVAFVLIGEAIAKHMLVSDGLLI